MSLEKRGDFQEGKSYTDDGSGEKARVSPKSVHDLIISSGKKPTGKLSKQASAQRSVDVEEFMEDLENGNS